MAINKEKTKKFQELWKMMDESLTRKEFIDNFKVVRDFVLKIKEKNGQEIDSLKKLALDLFDKIKGDNSINISKAKDELTKIANETLKEQENGMNFIRDKVRRIKEGVDGKDGRDGVDGEDGAEGPQGASTEVYTAEVMADMLETLSGDGKLKIDAVLNLEDRLDKLEKRPIGKGGGARKSVYTKRINLTDQCNGVLKEFLLPQDTVDVLGVWGTQFPVTFDEADFTFSGRTLTLTSEVGAPQAGQTLFALIQTLFYGKI